MSDAQETLEGLIADFVERVDAGESLDPERYIAEHGGEHADALRAALGRLAEADALFPAVGPGLVSREFGPYRIEGELGRGGMGRVVRAVHRDRPDHPLALKLLSITAAENARSAERLQREGEALRRLRHPGIVTVESIGTIDGTPFVAMQLVEGSTLLDFIRHAQSSPTSGGLACARLGLPGRGTPPQRVATIGAKIARAVAAAHDADLLHRDLKPSNVIVDTDGEPVVIDFGLAGGDAGPTITLTGDVIGTPHYMAPEQARGTRASVASDVYGIGAILYHLATLRPPHEGGDPLSVVDSVKGRRIPAVRRLEPGLPRPLATIIRRCLAYTPSDRYATATAIADDLERFAAGEAIRARPPGLVERVRDALRFHRTAAAGLAALAVIGVLVTLLLARDRATGIATANAWRAVASGWADGDREAVRRGARALDEAGASHWSDFVDAIADDRRPEPVEGDAMTRMRDGIDAARAKRYGDAVDHFDAAVRAAPDVPLALVMLADAAYRGDDTDRAEGEIKACVRLFPDVARLRRRLARIHSQQRRFDDAEAELVEAARIAPNDFRNWIALAKARFDAQLGVPEATRRFEPALEAVERAVERAGAIKSKRARRDARRLQARILDGLGRHRDAQAIYRELIAAHPDAFAERVHLAASLDSSHDVIAMKRAYLDVLERRPRFASALLQLAWYHAGARIRECEDCKRHYAAHPDEIDRDKAVHFALRALDAGRGRYTRQLEVVVEIARRFERPPEIVARLRALKATAYDDGREDDAARLDKAIWALERE